jgi:predicted metal-dependent HD superfamily phosphohydrolase
LWRRAARRLHGFTPAEIAWVSGTILATADHLGTPLQPRGLGWARSWMLDLDLTPIGEEAAWFRRNSRGLRAEARHMDEAAYDCGQIKFLAKLQAAPEILRTPRLKAAFEARARTNIAAETRRAAGRTAKRNGDAT